MIHLRTDLPAPDAPESVTAVWRAWSCDVRLVVARPEALPLARLFLEDLLDDVGRETAGFRPQRDGRLDLAATARAWVADETALQVARRLHTPVLVDVGGDVAVRSSADRPFTVDVGGDGIELHRGGVAAAAAADLPRRPEGAWVRATAWAPTAVEASAASATLLHLDRTASFEYLAERGLGARLVGHDGGVVHTRDWPLRLLAA